MSTPLVEKIKSLPEEERIRLIRLSMPRINEQYMLHIPHPVQQYYLTLRHEEAMYGGAAGGGKAAWVGTPVATPTGWTTMGALRPGDTVLDAQGRPTGVLAVSGWMYDHDCYRITFSDGETVVADADHIWTVGKSGGRNGEHGRLPEGSSFPGVRELGEGVGVLPGVRVPRSAQDGGIRHHRTTRELARTYNRGGRNRWFVDVALPLELPDADLPVDPYVYGVWLGDGDTRRGYVTVHDDDDLILQEIEKAGWEVERLEKYHVKIVGLSPVLKAAGIIGTYRNPVPKRILPMYLRASKEQRIALLQGIIDTDGHIDRRGQIELTLTSALLIEDCLELLATLGIKATAQESRATINGVDVGPRWRIKFVAPFQAARLPRKFERQDACKHRSTTVRRYITSIRKVKSRPVQCIKVDNPDGMFLVGSGMVPTHNSDALLMAALQYVDVPGYSALLLRRTWPDLSLPGAIMDRARSWLEKTDAQPKEGGRKWVFPSGARLTFGYLQYHKDVYQYQSAEFQFIGFDELTQFEERTYNYMFSRIRRPAITCINCGGAVKKYISGWKHLANTPNCRGGVFPDPKMIEQYSPASQDGLTLMDVPLRMRSATNPGGIGHVWVRERFIDPRTKRDDSVFVPARLSDNPSVDRETYVKNLNFLSPLDRERLLNGDWDVSEEGAIFQRHWFVPVEDVPAVMRRVRYWDLAATVDGDYTVGALVGLAPDGRWYIEDIQRMQGTPRDVERLVRQTALNDGREVEIVMEQEPGSAGVNNIDNYRRNILVGFNFHSDRPTGSKELRAGPVSSAAEAGNVCIKVAGWNRDFLDEAALFPVGMNDDMVDALSGAFGRLTFGKRVRLLA